MVWTAAPGERSEVRGHRQTGGIGIFGHDDMGDERLGRNAVLDQPFRCRRLAHFALTGSAGVFRTAQDEHLELRGGYVEPLGDILANPMLETATARAGFICDIDDDLFARQMWRQRAAIDASLARQSPRLVAVLLLTGFSDSERLFQILECERQLIGVEPFGPAAEAVALQFLDDADKALDLAMGSGELVGVPLTLGQQQSTQSVRIGRELIEASRHSAMESHPWRFVAIALAPELSCRGLQRRVRRRHPHSTHPHPIKTFEKSRGLKRMVKRRHKPISDSEISTLADQQRPEKVGSKRRLPTTLVGTR